MTKFFRIVRWIAALLWGFLAVISFFHEMWMVGITWFVLAILVLLLEIAYLNSRDRDD